MVLIIFQHSRMSDENTRNHITVKSIHPFNLVCSHSIFIHVQ